MTDRCKQCGYPLDDPIHTELCHGTVRRLAPAGLVTAGEGTFRNPDGARVTFVLAGDTDPALTYRTYVVHRATFPDHETVGTSCRVDRRRTARPMYFYVSQIENLVNCKRCKGGTR